MTQQLISPVTGEAFGSWEESGAAGVAHAVERARVALGPLRALSVWQRCDLLIETSHALARRRDQLVNDLLLEHGKVRAEAESEVESAIHSLQMVAEYARRADGRIPGMSDPNKRVLVERIPLGVLGVITPWNFPVMIPTEYLAPALAMGNAVVWKGAESTPAATAHLAAAFAEAGWPEGALEVVGGGPETGAALAARTDLAAMCFTGSTEVGQRIAAVGGMRKLLLELGGNGPTIVLGDADLERMAEAVTDAATICSGQSCAATERVLVEANCYDAAVEAIAAAAKARRVGAPDDPAAAFGPVHLAQTARIMAAHVGDAVTRGARVATGGSALGDFPTERYWPLTVLDGVDPQAQVFTDETFGPVLPITTFRTQDELESLVRASAYGLSGAVFSSDLDRAFTVAADLQVGSVVINDHSNVWEPHLPFGGHPGTRSGIGRVGGPSALQELSTTKSTVVHINPRRVGA